MGLDKRNVKPVHMCENLVLTLFYVCHIFVFAFLSINFHRSPDTFSIARRHQTIAFCTRLFYNKSVFHAYRTVFILRTLNI